MNITKFSIQRPIGISMIFMLITVLGLFSYSHIGVELLAIPTSAWNCFRT